MFVFRAGASLPQHFVFVCFASSHHLSVCHRTFQLYKHQQVDNNGFRRSNTFATEENKMCDALNFVKHLNMMNIISHESNVLTNTYWIH